MPDPAEYYAITRGAAATSQASGLVRRRLSPSGRADESLRSDGSWQPSSALFESEMGDVSPRRISAITEAEAEQLTARLQDQWTIFSSGSSTTATSGPPPTSTGTPATTATTAAEIPATDTAHLGGISPLRQA